MTDYFALLGFPRSPWLEVAEVKAQFARLSGPVHPDRVHQSDDSTRAAANQRYAELSAAQQCLADTRHRLRHLIELETGQLPKDVGAVPPHIGELFYSVGQALRTADELGRQKQAATSPMTRAQTMRRAVSEMDSLRELIAGLESRRNELDGKCRQLTAKWMTGERSIEELNALLRDYGYLNRWLDQLRERVLGLNC